jgi:predicted DCC family thiol-disulfide oxidoreductase YuxK
VLFDGDCSFCRLWVGYWKTQTGHKLEYAPWQRSLERFPGVTAEECRRAVQFIGPEQRLSGARAVFAILALAPGYRWLAWLYRFFPAFAALTEWGYGRVAARRDIGYRVTRLLWGDHVLPSTYARPAMWLRKVIAAVYVFAFASFGMQARGLIGEKGILPVGLFLRAASQQLGTAAPWRVPTLFWWGHSDYTILSIAFGGAGLAFLALVARANSKWYPPLFTLLFVYYLSLVTAGQTFMQFQWDYLLLEAGFLAIFLQPARSRIWLFHWLLFRLMLESGMAKLTSHDPVWRDLTALTFHYETQPLPTPLAWFIHQAPAWFHKATATGMFAVELVAPWLIFGPRRMKHAAAYAILALQAAIALTGNYTFFNLLTMALCVPLFDDACWKGKTSAPAARRTRRWVSVPLVAGIVLMSFIGVPEVLEPFGLVNKYGLFATMTTSRAEIRLEGSMDGEHWEPYVFRYKPGALGRAPGWVAPFQPRLDWQMWFAALSTVGENRWFSRMAVALLQGSEPVNALFEAVPFAGKPKFIRATAELYRFTTPAERASTGHWWKAETRGIYFPPVSLRSP